MKKIYLFTVIAASLSCNVIMAQFQWAKKGGLYAYDYGYGVVSDASGNAYVAGKFEQNAVFETSTLTCAGNHDAFIAKYLSDGTLDWIRRAGGVNGDYAWSLSTDGTNLYVTGEIEGFNDIIAFQNSTITLTTAGDNDIFIAKYDMGGNLIWAKREGGGKSERGMGVANDAAGNVYVCGHITDTSNFNGTTAPGYGGKDIFVAKYDMNGNFQWARVAGSTGRDEAKSVKVDASGNVYICGLFSNNTTFGAQTLTCTPGYFDAFIAKYDANGTLQWVKKSGGDYDDVAWALDIDQNKLYVTGEFNAYATFDAVGLTTVGNADVYVACYDDLGNVQWASRAGGPLIDRARGITVKGSDIFITGQYGGTATFGGGSINAPDSSDIFIAGLTTAGTFSGAITVQGAADLPEAEGFESGNAVWYDGAGTLLATGATLNGGIFGATSLSPFSRTDFFVTKILTTNIGLKENEQDAFMNLYPSPNNGSFKLSMANVNSESVNISIHNILGESVYVNSLKVNNGNVESEINTANLSNGTYYIQVKSDSKSYNLKTVINK
ncbi:MAG: hypothetical protein K0S32_4334 [Bacteroidetes bacterium]|jgi:hypothetical protein|nr:hypothetical protein [Bacteroidota bacterium]